LGTLEFDNISLGVRDIDRRSVAFGAVTETGRAGFDAVGFKMSADAGLIKGIYTETKVI